MESDALSARARRRGGLPFTPSGGEKRLDREGALRYINVHDINTEPSLEELLAAVGQLTGS